MLMVVCLSIWSSDELVTCAGCNNPFTLWLYTSDCLPTFPSNSVIKFADDSPVVGLTTGGDESAYRQEVQSLFEWRSVNNLVINTQQLWKRHNSASASWGSSGKNVSARSCWCVFTEQKARASWPTGFLCSLLAVLLQTKKPLKSHKKRRKSHWLPPPLSGRHCKQTHSLKSIKTLLRTSVVMILDFRLPYDILENIDFRYEFWC